MIIFKKGDLFKSRCDTLVNTVNINGIMGKGLALQFKKKYPDMYKEYKKVCSGKSYKGYGKLKEGGDLWLYPNTDMFDNHKILCFATKENWWNKSKIEWIERGLQTLIKYWSLKDESPYGDTTNSFYFYELMNIKSIAWPKLGCTNGKLDWDKEVKPLMIKYLENLDIINEIYE